MIEEIDAALVDQNPSRYRRDSVSSTLQNVPVTGGHLG